MSYARLGSLGGDADCGPGTQWVGDACAPLCVPPSVWVAGQGCVAPGGGPGDINQGGVPVFRGMPGQGGRWGTVDYACPYVDESICRAEEARRVADYDRTHGPISVERASVLTPEAKAGLGVGALVLMALLFV